jgi:hypothetical protein
MNGQKWMQRGQPGGQPRNIPATPGSQQMPGGPGGAPQGDPIKIIEQALLSDSAFLMQLIQKMSQIAQQAQGGGAGGPPPGGPAGGPPPGMPGG